MEKLDIKKHLPYGSTLREVLDHPSLTDNKLKKMLRRRGVYTEDTKSRNTYPLLLSMVFSPKEFEFIAENIRGKESTQKIQSRLLQWNDNKDLIESIPDTIDLKSLIAPSRPKYEIVSQGNFAIVDGDRNRVKMKFRCETTNYNSSWYRTKSDFEGEILVEKVKDQDQIYLRMIYTSPETQSAADEGVKFLVDDFKKKGFTKTTASVEKILYSSFSNEERVRFFLSLASNSDIFTFKSFTDIDIAPDKTKSLSKEVKRLMTGNVNSLNIHGDALHEHFLIKEAGNHDFIEIYSVEAYYDFSYHGAKGKCRILFGFVGEHKKRLGTTEFSINVTEMTLGSDYAHVSKEVVKRFLLQEFEKFKTQTYSHSKALVKK